MLLTASFDNFQIAKL